MTNIELQAYEAVKSIARQTARIADALEAIRSLDALERACEKVLDAETLAAVIAEKKRISEATP